jgi:hypothetical protein
MVFSNNLLMGAASTTAAPAAGWVPKGAIWLDRDSAQYLSRTPGSASDRKTWTFSVWCKRGVLGHTDDATLFGAGYANTGYYNNIAFPDTGDSDEDKLYCAAQPAASTSYGRITEAVFRDVTAWYHMVIVLDTTQTYDDDRIQIYVNGGLAAQSDYYTGPPPEDQQWAVNNNVPHVIGRYCEIAQYYDGYLSEIILLDGYAGTASDFGEENSDGVWIPKDPTTIVTDNKGTNGFWLDFADSGGTDAVNLGLDVSGNDNHFTPVNMAAANWTSDRPADEAENIGNYPTFNPAFSSTSAVLSNVNRTMAATTWGRSTYVTQTLPTSGKYYFEVECVTAANQWCLSFTLNPLSDHITEQKTTWLLGQTQFELLNYTATSGASGQSYNGTTWQYYGNNSSSNWPYGTSSMSDGDVIGIAYDADNNAIWASVNDVWTNLNGSDSSATIKAEIEAGTTTNAARVDANVIGAENIYFSFGGNSAVSIAATLKIAPSDWSGSAPSGFVAWGTQNLPAVTVTKPSDNFLPMLYEGNGTSQRVGNFIPFTDSHTVNYSARFDSGDSEYLEKTFSSSEGGYWTFSTWFKPAGNTGSYRTLLQAGTAGGSRQGIQIQDESTGGGFDIYGSGGSNSGSAIMPARVGRSGTWVNAVISYNNGDIKVYLDGVEQTLTTDTWGTGTSFIGTDTRHRIGSNFSGGQYLDGYMAETVFVTGTGTGAVLTPSSFGQTDTSTNRWIPKDVSGLTFGTNGFYLNMADKNDLGDDESGEGNDFTMNNMDTTNGSNQMYDTPTRNLPVISPVAWVNEPNWGGPNVTLSQGNLTAALTNSSNGSVSRTWDKWAVDSGKWYVENTVITYGTWSAGGLGIAGAPAFGTSHNPSTAWSNVVPGVNYYPNENSTSAANINRVINGGGATVLETITLSAGDTMAIAIDLDSSPQTIKMYFNNVLKDTTTLPAGYVWMFTTAYSGNGTSTYNFGQWINLNSVDMTLDSEAGGYFRYDPPTDYKAITQDNLAENTAGITGFSWIKNRDAADDHIVQNRVNGVYEYTDIPTNSAETTDTNSVQRFLQQGVQIGSMDEVNTSGESFVLWQWANDGTETTDSGSVGTLNCTYRANTDAGFSVGKVEGASGSRTFAHGLGVVPKFVIVKSTSLARGYYTYHVSVGNTAALDLSSTAIPDTSANYWQNTTPTTTLISVGTSSSTFNAGETWKFWAWAEIEGYSKFGSYEGNGNDDGPYVNLGFKPSYVLIKRTNAVKNWMIIDAVRDSYNPVNLALLANSNVAESSSDLSLDFTSNGFKLRLGGASYGATNEDNGTYVYAAFAENPFGGSGVAQSKAR